MGLTKAVLLLPAATLLLAFSCGRQLQFTVLEKEVETEDVRLYLRVAGDPEARNFLIGVHGGPGGSSHYLVDLDTLRGEDFAVVTYDQRGAGRSGKPSGGYSLMDYVGDLEAVRKTLGVEKIALFGHSWGGLIALRYAAVHPGRVRSMILMGSAPPTAAAVYDGEAGLVQRVLDLQEKGVIPRQLPEDGQTIVRAIFPAFFSDPNFLMPPELQAMTFTPTASESTNVALGEWDITGELERLEHPILMLWGEDDPFGIPMAEATRAALPSARIDFVLLDHCGHYWHERKGEFYSRVRKFLGLPEPRGLE
ncbi:MAG: alpha/beta hydrolase [Bacteroidota bacterium]